MDDDTKTLYDELKREFTLDYIHSTGTLIHEMAEDFNEKYGLDGKVYFDDNIFHHCLIDILVDIARLKEFHDIDLINNTKLMAYSASWILKRKPFQLIEGCDKKYRNVNELFALTMLLRACGCFGKNERYYVEDEDDLNRAFKQILYHLKYRNTNPQTLELFLIGMETGIKINMVQEV